jgi:uncharacterized protein DUF1298/wax ester synthase-like acyl-CoA acyltransferase family protein
MGQRLDHERPLWRIDVIPLEEERTALVGRFHHAMADGVSVMRLLGSLLWDPAEVDSGASKPEKKAKPPASSTGRPRSGWLGRLPGAARREFRRGADTSLDHHIGPGRELAWRGFELEHLKQIEHAAGEGVTVNDVVLAVVAGGLRGWFESGARPAALRAQVPVSLHARDESTSDIGNRDSYFNLDLPLEEPDPLARLRTISLETQERKLDHDAETLYAFFHALGHFRPLYRGVTRIVTGPREFALSVSNVPGPRERPLVLGHSIEELCSFAEPADRHALRIAAISLDDRLAFGLCADPDAIADLPKLASSFDEALRELSAAAGVGG